MDHRDKIIDFVKMKGPVLPIQISKLIGMDMVMASAHLAELTATKKMKISAIKVGGSPLYYLAGQEAMLLKYTSNLNEKELKALELLKENKILRDSEQVPVIRVALREIKDFAMPLNVKYGDTSEIFWKWFLDSDEEAGKIIKSKLGIAEKVDKIEVKEETKIQTEIKKEIQQKQSEIVQKQREFPIEKKIEEEPAEKFQQQLKEAVEKPIQQKARGRKPKESSKEDEFMKNIMKFFEKNKIDIISTEVTKKNSEIDFIIEIPSVMGSLQYYCKAKNKKRISDSDLSNAYVKGQFKKLPVIVLSPGELSAKAEEMIKKELNNLTFKQI
ncbi:MAG TPA: hypothetical protein VJJ52_03220 [Candidatus Nanoarchaeia archaeon]|nr:hypothetical protein [Candidatus Nanoarchaeia archaeon]